jgi:hypothetical protein
MNWFQGVGVGTGAWFTAGRSEAQWTTWEWRVKGRGQSWGLSQTSVDLGRPAAALCRDVHLLAGGHRSLLCWLCARVEEKQFILPTQTGTYRAFHICKLYSSRLHSVGLLNLIVRWKLVWTFLCQGHTCSMYFSFWMVWQFSMLCAQSVKRRT